MSLEHLVHFLFEWKWTQSCAPSMHMSAPTFNECQAHRIRLHLVQRKIPEAYEYHVGSSASTTSPSGSAMLLTNVDAAPQTWIWLIIFYYRGKDYKPYKLYTKRWHNSWNMYRIFLNWGKCEIFVNYPAEQQSPKVCDFVIWVTLSFSPLPT